VNTPSFKPTPEIAKMFSTLSADDNFVKFMELLEDRCTGLAVWGHSIPDDIQRTWVGGRVQELSDLLKVFHQRNEFLKQYSEMRAGTE
jgi:hypothetical protein